MSIWLLGRILLHEKSVAGLCSTCLLFPCLFLFLVKSHNSSVGVHVLFCLVVMFYVGFVF